MTRRSWIHLKADEEHLVLDEESRSKDVFNAADIGWVGQMRWLLKDYGSKTNKRVLDPFAGLATTLIACRLEGYEGYGVEIEPARVQAGRARLKEHGVDEQKLIHGDSHSLPFEDGFFGLVTGSIPYFGADRESSDGWKLDPGHLYALQPYKDYLDSFSLIAREVHRVTEQGGLAVFVVQNIRLAGGSWVPLAWDLAKVLSTYFRMHEERVLVYDQRGTKSEGSPETHPATRLKTDRTHEYVLIGEKN